MLYNQNCELLVPPLPFYQLSLFYEEAASILDKTIASRFPGDGGRSQKPRDCDSSTQIGNAQYPPFSPKTLLILSKAAFPFQPSSNSPQVAPVAGDE